MKYSLLLLSLIYLHAGANDFSAGMDINGNNNVIYIDQIGNSQLKGHGQNTSIVQGSYNTVTVKQGAADPARNEMSLRVVGDSNQLALSQSRDDNGNQIGSNNHYQAIDVNGYNNTLVTQQRNTGGVGGHYLETTVNGNTNNVVATQTDNGNKIMFATVNGNSNTIDARQKDTGQHSLTVGLTGNGNAVNSLQEGAGSHNASINLTNAGGAGTVNLMQTGTTAQSFLYTQSCITLGGCSVTITQGQ
jgi:hypothetical protein